MFNLAEILTLLIGCLLALVFIDGIRRALRIRKSKLKVDLTNPTPDQNTDFEEEWMQGYENNKDSQDLSDVEEDDINLDIEPQPAINLNIMIRNGRSIDAEKISKAHKDPDSVSINTSDIIVEGEKLHSDLFRSVCPITGQPDWASFQVEYSGKQICASDLLTYLCSYRDHPGYHEECTERVFHDIYRRCGPSSLSISLNFLRRGGIDINIYRSTNELTAEEIMTRLVRQ